MQKRLSIRLDHRAHIFQNLNGATDEIQVKLEGNETYLYNSIYDTRSAIYHGNGGSKVSVCPRMRHNCMCSQYQVGPIYNYSVLLGMLYL